jgi:two-component system sensor histidine kinase EvgS
MKNTRFISLFLLLLLPATVVATSPSPELQLTEDERKWLEGNPTAKFTGDPNWLPYEAFDSHDNYIGIVSEHLDLIASITGLAFKMSPSKTWTESTEKAKQGLVDILSETDDSDLKSHLDFTIPYISNPIVIAMRSRENYVEGITSINDRKIAFRIYNLSRWMISRMACSLYQREK